MCLGVDIHKAFCQTTVVDETGTIVDRAKVPTDLSHLYDQDLPNERTTDASKGIVAGLIAFMDRTLRRPNCLSPLGSIGT